MENTLNETIEKAVKKIDELIESEDQKAQQKHIEALLKPPTKAEIRELKEYKRQQKAKPTPGSAQWLARIQEEREQ